MALFERRPFLRWLAPLIAGLVLVLGATGIGALAASAGGSLPQRSAAQLLVDVQKARPTGLSGTVVQTSALGLPSLPSVTSGSGSGGASSSFSSLLSGSHPMRVWYAGPNRVRLALLGQLGESDVVRNGTDLWTWSSDDRAATHRTVALSAAQPTLPSAATPQAVADMVLGAIGPTTIVSTADSVSVAGRSAYELVLRPRDASSLIGSVRLAVDGKAHVPTRVEIFAKGKDTPAFEVGFTSFDPTTPPSSVFSFNPPPGTKVTQARTTSHTSGSSHKSIKPTVVGKGWTRVLVAKTPSDLAGSNDQLKAVLRSLPTVAGSWGSGHLLTSALISAVLTDDGRVAVGAVSPDRLYAALAR